MLAGKRTVCAIILSGDIILVGAGGHDAVSCASSAAASAAAASAAARRAAVRRRAASMIASARLFAMWAPPVKYWVWYQCDTTQMIPCPALSGNVAAAHRRTKQPPESQHTQAWRRGRAVARLCGGRGVCPHRSEPQQRRRPPHRTRAEGGCTPRAGGEAGVGRW